MANESYWIVEWRYPDSLGNPASQWMPIDRPMYVSKKAAENYPQRGYYEYRISEFKRVDSQGKG